MKKNTIKAFTLVEMLIVIVIIGILIAALLPRMQAAQGRARDVSRKTALSQVQSAIVTYQGDYGKWPFTGSDNGTGIKIIEDQLINAGMTEVPSDPLKGTTFSGVGAEGRLISDYGYVISYRNGVQSGGFLLMSKTESAGSSNWVVCSGADVITGGTDLKDVHPCSSVEEVKTEGECSNPHNAGATNECKGTLTQMRYIIMY